MAKYISWFRDIGLDDRPKVGGKGGSLGELQRAGIDGAARLRRAHRGVRGFHRRAGAARAAARARRGTRGGGSGVDRRPCRASCARALKTRRCRADLQQEIREAYGRLGEARASPAVAVRSSATTEDAADASFAGLQDTYLWVTQAEAVIAKIRSCWGSLYSLESLSYRRRQGLQNRPWPWRWSCRPWWMRARPA